MAGVHSALAVEPDSSAVQRPLVLLTPASRAGTAGSTGEIQAILAITQAIITSLDPDAVLQTLVEKVREIDGVRASAVFEYDEESSRLRVRCSRGLSESYTQSRFTVVRVGTRAVGKAFEIGDVVVVGDIDSDPLFDPPVRRRMHKEDLRAVLAAPLVARSRLLGVLCVYFDRHLAPDDVDTGIVRTLANLAAVALDNARLFQAQRRATQDLRELSRQLSEQSEMLRKTTEIHEWLVKTVLARDGLDAVTGALARLAGSTVVVEDVRLNVISVSHPESNRRANNGEAGGLGLAPFRADPRVQDHLTRARTQRRPHILHAIPEIGLAHTRITMPSFVGDNLLAFVSILPPERELGQLDHILSEQGAIAIALELMKSKAAFDAEQRLRGDLLRSLLTGKFDSLGANGALLAASKFDLAGLQRVMVVRCDRPEPDHPTENNGGQMTLRSQVYATVERLARAACPNSMVVAEKDTFTVLLGSSERLADSAVRDLGEKIVSSVAEQFEPSTVSVGIGGTCAALGDVRRSHDEATRALEIGSILHKRGFVMAFSDLGVFEVLFRGNTVEELREFADRYMATLAAYDQKHGSGLVATLETYISRNFCLNETASDLFLHPKTVKYRLQKIEELCGIDLRRAEDLMNLQVAIRLYRIVPPRAA